MISKGQNELYQLILSLVFVRRWNELKSFSLDCTVLQRRTLAG